MKAPQYGFKVFKKDQEPFLFPEDTFNYWNLLWIIPIRILFYVSIIFVIWFYTNFPIQMLWLILYIPIFLIAMKD